MCSFNIEFTLFSESKRVICSIVWGVPRVGVGDYMHRLLNVLRFEEHRQKHRRRWFLKKHRRNIALFRKKAQRYVKNIANFSS